MCAGTLVRDRSAHSDDYSDDKMILKIVIIIMILMILNNSAGIF